MSRERRHRLEYGLRKNRGRLLRDEWLARISQACGEEIDPSSLLSLEETEHLKERFFGLQQSIILKRFFWPEDRGKQVEEVVRQLGDDISVDCVLFHSLDHYIGALKINSQLVTKHSFAIWRVTEDDLMIATPSIDDGLRLELNIYGRQDNEFELSTWGIFIPRDDLIVEASVSSKYL